MSGDEGAEAVCNNEPTTVSVEEEVRTPDQLPGNDMIGSLDCNRHVRISKWLTMILRHRALEMKLEMQGDGSINIEDVVRASPKFALWEIKDVVNNSEKNRFKMNADETRIKAVNGCSIKENRIRNSMVYKISCEDSQKLPYVLLHGIHSSRLEGVWYNGVLPIEENGVHFVINPLRINKGDAIIEVRTSDLLDRGFELFEYETGVFYCYNKAVPTSIFHKVLQWKWNKWCEIWRAP